MSKVIKLNHDHLAECSKLYSQIFSDAPWSEPWDENSARQRLQEIFDTPGFIGIGYFESDEIYGFALGYCESWIANKHYYLKEMCVNTRQQSKGVGTAILKQLKNELNSRNVEKIYLLTLHDSSAYRFYQKHDFTLSDKLIVMGCKI